MDRIKIPLILLTGAVLGLVAGCEGQPAETPPGVDRPAPTTKAPQNAPAPRDTKGAETPARPGPAGPDGSRVRVGQSAPDFEVTTTDGHKFRLSEQRGKVVLVNFFATWCPPCRAEMPYLQKEVFEKVKSDRFVMIALGREHDNAEVARFKEERRLGFPMAGDPGRSAFALYAEKSIPRTVVVDTDGRVIFQSIGFSEGESRQMVSLIRARVGRRGSDRPHQ
jgi:peroxiredoxin